VPHEFQVPRATQSKRKAVEVVEVEVEVEVVVPPSILNRRRGAISFSEPPQQLKDLVERVAKRQKTT